MTERHDIEIDLKDNSHFTFGLVIWFNGISTLDGYVLLDHVHT